VPVSFSKDRRPNRPDGRASCLAMNRANAIAAMIAASEAEPGKMLRLRSSVDRFGNAPHAIRRRSQEVAGILSAGAMTSR
jgi:hypothetical protein